MCSHTEKCAKVNNTTLLSSPGQGKGQCASVQRMTDSSRSLRQVKDRQTAVCIRNVSLSGILIDFFYLHVFMSIYVVCVRS